MHKTGRERGVGLKKKSIIVFDQESLSVLSRGRRFRPRTPIGSQWMRSDQWTAWRRWRSFIWAHSWRLGQRTTTVTAAGMTWWRQQPPGLGAIAQPCTANWNLWRRVFACYRRGAGHHRHRYYALEVFSLMETGAAADRVGAVADGIHLKTGRYHLYHHRYWYQPTLPSAPSSLLLSPPTRCRLPVPETAFPKWSVHWANAVLRKTNKMQLLLKSVEVSDFS